MTPIYRKTVATNTGEKRIKVFLGDVKEIDEAVDILTVSVFYSSYEPSPGTMIGALGEMGISVESLSTNPEIDLRKICNIWLSKEIKDAAYPIRRIGCIEMSEYSKNRERWMDNKSDIISSIQAFFRMLDIASLSGIKAEVVALPILGSGSQRIDMELIMVPLINECVHYLKQNAYVREIWMVEINPEKACKLISAIDNSYLMQREFIRQESGIAPEHERRAFISYSSVDKNIADNLCAKLEKTGIKVWYAPRDIHYNDYASSIVDAISNCEYFVVILSKNSLQSNHVLNEIDLAFQEMSARGMKFCPLKIDEEEMGPAFRYYLSRQHWMDAHIPPIENRLEEFVDALSRKKQ